jgi:hypothetical protein
MVEKLRSLGKKVDVVSKTHTASARVSGVTLDHWVRRHVLHGTCNADVLFLEEYTQSDVNLLTALNRVSHIQFLLAGDPNQFGSCYNSFRGQVVPDGKLESSRFLHRICGGKCLRLTECRRSDVELFNFYSTLVLGGLRFVTELGQVIQEARELFTYPGLCENNFCLSHRTRMRLNRELCLALKPAGAILLRCQQVKGQALAQNPCIWLWVGMHLLGATQSAKKGIRNGLLYRVVAIDLEGEQATLEHGDFRQALSFKEVTAYLRISFARTYASIQGDEVTGSLRLHDTKSKFFTRKHLYVGLSRARDASKVSVL